MKNLLRTFILVAVPAIFVAIPAIAVAQSQQVLPLTTIFETSLAIEMRANLPRAVGLDPALRARIQTMVDKGFGEMRDVAEEDFRDNGLEDYWRGYSLSLNWAEQFVSSRYISLIETHWQYTGGAHGNSYFTSLLWDLKTSQEVTLGDILGDVSNGASALQAIAAELRRQLIAKKIEIMEMEPDEARADPGLEGLDATLEALGNFTLLPSDVSGKSGGILFHFAPYMLGSYAEGSYELAVPFAVFKKYLLPDYENLFGGNPVQLQTLTDYRSPGISILLDPPLPDSNISSPLALEGEAPDFWFEKGEARVEVRSDSDKLLGEGIITAMPKVVPSGSASGMVRFSGNIAFDVPQKDSYGKIVFRRGNMEDGEIGSQKIEWWVSF